MIISEDKKSKIYKAIHEPIMETRIDLRKNYSLGLMDASHIDDQLFYLTNEIWSEVRAVLNIS